MPPHDHRDDLEKVPLFRDLSRRQRQALSRGAVRVPVPAGCVLFNEDSEGHELVVVLEGAVEVRRDGVQIAELGPGDYFGEVALVKHARRNATAVARSEGTIIVCIGQEEFAGVVKRFPEIAKLVKETSDARQAPQ